MAADDHSGARPAGPVVLRIKLRYADVDTMVQRFAVNVGKSGLFLPTKSIHPVGTEIKFELRLATDAPVLVGLGRVKHARPPDPANPKAAFGIAIELVRVSREGREVIMKMLERRRELGLAEVVIPIPEDVETARRSEVETQPRADTASVMRESMSQLAAAPADDLLLTPRRTAAEPSGNRAALPALAAEPVRARRPRLAELIEKAGERSPPLAVAVPGLDEEVDVERALVRARALAGGDLDVDLASLREASAAPIEIGIEAASAELARQLGVMPIAKRRDRSAHWAPPPSVGTVSTVGAAVAPAAAAVPAAAAAPAAAPEPVNEAAAAEVPNTAELPHTAEPGEPTTEPSIEPAPSTDPLVLAPAEDELYDRGPPAAVPSEAFVIRESDRIDRRDHYTGEGRAATDVGDEESTVDRVAPTLEAPVVEADDDLSSFERALDAARIHTGQAAAAPPSEDDPDDEAVELENTNVKRRQKKAAKTNELLAKLDHKRTYAEANAERDIAAIRSSYPQIDDQNIEEISDLDVVAIDDDDQQPKPAAAAPWPGDDDFSPDPSDPPHVLAFKPRDLGEDFDEPHAYSRRTARPRIAHVVPPTDLEQALSALDDTQLPPTQREERQRPTPRPLPGLPVHRTGEVPTTTKSSRAPTDDGILIDFDDDD